MLWSQNSKIRNLGRKSVAGGRVLRLTQVPSLLRLPSSENASEQRHEVRAAAAIRVGDIVRLRDDRVVVGPEPERRYKTEPALRLKVGKLVEKAEKKEKDAAEKLNEIIKKAKT